MSSQRDVLFVRASPAVLIPTGIKASVFSGDGLPSPAEQCHCPVAVLLHRSSLPRLPLGIKHVTPPARASGRVNKSQTQTTWRASHPFSLPSSLAPFPLADNQLSGKCEGCLLTQMWRDEDELIWQKSALCLTSLSLYAAE